MPSLLLESFTTAHSQIINILIQLAYQFNFRTNRFSGNREKVKRDDESISSGCYGGCVEVVSKVTSCDGLNIAVAVAITITSFVY